MPPTIRISKAQRSPHVFIERDAFDDMLCIARATNSEVAWFAQVEELEDNMFLVDHVFLPKQESSTATVEIQPEDLAEFAEEYISAYGPDAYNRLRCWGHSHAKMGVFASAQDQKTVDELSSAIKATFIAIRVNHAGDLAVDVAYANGVTVEGADASVGWIPREKEEEWAAIVKERVQRITYKGGKQKKGLPPAANTTPGAFGSLTINELYGPSFDDDSDDDDLKRIEFVADADEERAALTEGATGIKRYPYEAALPYLKRVERLLVLEEDMDD